MIIRHQCKYRDCVNPDHLKIGTDLNNAQDRERMGRGRKSKINQNKLLKLIDKNFTLEEIAEALGVTTSAIAHFMKKNNIQRKKLHKNRNNLKLNWKIVNEIRKKWTSKYAPSKTELQKKYGFRVDKILNNTSWHDPNYKRPKKNSNGDIIGYYE